MHATHQPRPHKPLKHCPPDSNVSINCRAVTNGFWLTGNTLAMMGKLWLLMGVIKRFKSLSRSFYTTVLLPSATVSLLKVYEMGVFFEASHGDAQLLLLLDNTKCNNDIDFFRD